MKFLLLLFMPALAFGQAELSSVVGRGVIDFGLAASTKPAKSGTSLPGTCGVGEQFFKSDATAGQNLYGCTATNVWTAQAGGGGGSATIPFEHTRTSSTVLTVGTGTHSLGDVVTLVTSSCTFTITGSTSTGTLRTCLNPSNELIGAYTSGITVTGSAGCVAVPATACPVGSKKLFEIPASTVQGQYDTLTAAMDLRSIIHRDTIEVGDGLTESISAPGVKTLVVDATQVPRFFTGSGAPSGACTTGRDFYTRTSNADLYKCNGSAWVLQGGAADPWTTIDIVDHFVSGNANTDNTAGVGILGTMNWKIFQASGLATLSNTDQSATRNGIVRMTTGAGSGELAGLQTTLVPRTSLHAGSSFDIMWDLKIHQTDANFSARFGVSCEPSGSAPNNMPTDGIYFEKTGADTSWFGVGANASAVTRSTAVAAIDTNWHDFRMWRSDASTISFSVDGGTAQTVATNIPTSGCNLGIYIVNSTAAVKIMSLDKFRLKITGID